MPQMAPISWLMLFIMFFIIFIMFNSMNYYCFFQKMPSSQQAFKSNKTMIWKW